MPTGRRIEGGWLFKNEWHLLVNGPIFTLLALRHRIYTLVVLHRESVGRFCSYTMAYNQGLNQRQGPINVHANRSIR